MTLFSFPFAGESFTLSGDHLLRLGAAFLLAGIIGLEREFRDKPAGLRTMILIGVGACVFSLVSQLGSGPYGDPTRMAAQIVSGIGFLGAGAIIRGRGSIVGLTTAATIWAVAAVGVAVGFGEYMLATSATVGVLVVLLMLNRLEKVVGRIRDRQVYQFTANRSPDVVDRVRSLFSGERLQCIRMRWFEEDEAVVFDIVAKGGKANHDRLRTRLLQMDEYRLRRC